MLASSRRNSCASGSAPSPEGVEHLIEQFRRQEAESVTIRAGRFSQIVAGPDEFVAFVDDDPRTRGVETQMALDPRGNFDCGPGIGRRRMGDWQDRHDRCPICFSARGEHDDAWPVLPTLLLSRAMLVMPEIGVVEHEARLRRGDPHAASYSSSSKAFRRSCRLCIRDRMIDRTWSSESSAVAKLRRCARKRSNSSNSSGGTKYPAIRP
jgi:hypothetical protein